MTGFKADPEHLARLSYNLKRLRKARQMTQWRLGKACGLATTYVSNVERGRVDPRMSTLRKIVRGLGCSADELFREIPK